MSRPVNPLYVVKNDGKDIETAGNFIELILKRLGLDFVYEYFHTILRNLLLSIKSTSMFAIVIDLIDDYKTMLMAVEKNLKKYGLA